MRFAIPLLVVAAAFSTACTHTISGYVVRGDIAGVEWLDAGMKPDGEPVAGAQITIERDPDRMTRELAGTATAGANGEFTLPVAGFGAGWMQEVWRIRASRSRAGSADWIGELPSGGKILVIVVSPTGGSSNDELWQGNIRSSDTAESLMQEVERYR